MYLDWEGVGFTVDFKYWFYSPADTEIIFIETAVCLSLKIEKD